MHALHGFQIIIVLTFEAMHKHKKDELLILNMYVGTLRFDYASISYTACIILALGLLWD